MIMYLFECEECKYITEMVSSPKNYTKDAKKQTCGSCNSKDIFRRYDLDNVKGIVRQADCEVTTVKQLAERNTKKYGAEKVSKMIEGQKTHRPIKEREGMTTVTSASDFVDNPNVINRFKNKTK